ncbi:MAG: sensor histidine kinase [Deltaproteobacteria bacterium]|nr:sensor histidine kinase [Deltaproteobacteria bacterium]
MNVCQAQQRNATRIGRGSLSARLLQLREAEVTRIKRELHDHLGQLLFAIGMDVKWVRNHCPDVPLLVHERLQETARLVEEATQATRALSAALRSDALNWGSLGLEDTLTEYAAELAQRSGLPISFSSHLTTPEEICPETASHIYHIVQEALLNAVRHAVAARVTVELRHTEQELVVSVTDDGKGFKVAAVSELQALGLAELRERAGLIGGRLEVRSAPGAGTIVRLYVPRARG